MNLKDTIRTIELLESLNTNDDYAYERAVLAYLQLGGLPIFKISLPAGVSFFHARTHNKEEYFYNVSDISLPPPEYVKYFARCNRPFQSVFYCSETRPTSYMELVEYWAETKASGDKIKVTLGLWKLKKSLTAIIIPTPKSNKRISDFDKKHGAVFDSCISKYSGEELESQIMFYNFLFEKFRKPAKKDLKTYIITSAYCNVAFMHSKGQADALYYPSVPFQDNGINLCINKDFFKHENIELILASRYEFIKLENERGNQSFYETGKIETEKINWEINQINWNE